MSDLVKWCFEESEAAAKRITELQANVEELGRGVEAGLMAMNKQAARIKELTNELAACRSEQEIGYDDARQQQATITKLTAALDRIGHAEYISPKPIGFRDQATIVQAELDARIDYARAALQEKT